MPLQTVLVALTFDTDAHPVDLAHAVHARLDEVYPDSNGIDLTTPTDLLVVATTPAVLATLVDGATVGLESAPDEAAHADAAFAAIQHLSASGGEDVAVVGYAGAPA